MDGGNGGDGKVEEWRREGKQEEFEEAIATRFVEVVENINGAAPLRSRSLGAMPGYLPRQTKAWHSNATKIGPSLTRSSPGACRFSERAGEQA